jgi:hypothetical protein
MALDFTINYGVHSPKSPGFQAPHPRLITQSTAFLCRHKALLWSSPMGLVSTKTFPLSGIESNLGNQTFFLPRVFQVLGIWHALSQRGHETAQHSL